ncbi:MAG: hypothetical protein M1481_00580 [Candidatus Thermoplasmatota archaeon]|jgi:hypothetical protein|nr:hypothetical protein [Candidatus Thermoplasmatota archaeon]MCL5962848.1 hypothetical protein [Candidatus Thermoplasmatota archaeon]
MVVIIENSYKKYVVDPDKDILLCRSIVKNFVNRTFVEALYMHRTKYRGNQFYIHRWNVKDSSVYYVVLITRKEALNYMNKRSERKEPYINTRNIKKVKWQFK